MVWEGRRFRIIEKLNMVLILVFVEDGLGERAVKTLVTKFGIVLILVFVEDGLGELAGISDAKVVACLNPCFCGRWFGSRLYDEYGSSSYMS